MRPRSSLRLRFTLASTALVFVVSSLGAIAVYTVQEHIEDNLLLELMQREVDEYARLYREDQSELPPRSSELRSYIVGPGEAGDLPAELRGMPPGIWHDVLMDGRNYQVANFTLQDKRFYLTYDITMVEQREAWLTLALISTVLIATGLAALIGWRVSRVVVAPVARLAADIKALDPERPEPGFTERFPDSDLGVIAAAFDAYARRLAEFVVRERSFTEDISHELRTPLSVVTTATERLEGDPGLPEALRPTVERLARAGRQMQLTTQALLFMAREAEPAEAAMRLVPLRQVIDDAVAVQQRALGDKHFTLATTLAGDAPQVPHGLAALVIGNLLRNAAQHSGAAGAELTQDGASVTVLDRGAGIPAEELPRIFERHYRGARSGGLGLGLHIVKRICDRQGWTIGVRSEPGRGTSVSVLFAAKAEPVLTKR